MEAKEVMAGEEDEPTGVTGLALAALRRGMELALAPRPNPAHTLIRRR